jgi:hypothetical protein
MQGKDVGYFEAWKGEKCCYLGFRISWFIQDGCCTFDLGAIVFTIREIAATATNLCDPAFGYIFPCTGLARHQTVDLECKWLQTEESLYCLFYVKSLQKVGEYSVEKRKLKSG